MANAMKLNFKDKDRFSGSNYDVWAHRVKTLLQIEELWDIVNGTVLRPDANTLVADLNAWVKKDLRARAILELTIDNTMIRHIKDAISAHLTWIVRRCSQPPINLHWFMPPGLFGTAKCESQ